MNNNDSSFETMLARQAEQRQQWAERQERIVASVSCPRCKAQAGQPCNWGATNAGQVHQPRATKAQKLGV